jgi:hypothetical protein
MEQPWSSQTPPWRALPSGITYLLGRVSDAWLAASLTITFVLLCNSSSSKIPNSVPDLHSTSTYDGHELPIYVNSTNYHDVGRWPALCVARTSKPMPSHLNFHRYNSSLSNHQARQAWQPYPKANPSAIYNNYKFTTTTTTATIITLAKPSRPSFHCQWSLARPLFDSHHWLSLNFSVKQSQIALAILLKIGRYCVHLFYSVEFFLENDAELSQECLVWIGIHMNMKF